MSNTSYNSKIVLLIALSLILDVFAVSGDVRVIRPVDKDDSETDFDDDDDGGGADHDDGADTSSRLLHELNEGPVIEREPVDKEIVSGGSANSTSNNNNAFMCAARNALSVQVRCSSKNLSESQASSTPSEPTDPAETIGRGPNVAEHDSRQQQHQQPEVNSFGASLVVPSSTLVDLVDPMTGVRHIEIHATIDDRVFGKFPTAEGGRPVRTLYCTCYAWSSKGKVISRISTVKLIDGVPVEKKAAKSSKANLSGTRVVSLGEKVLLECPLERPHPAKHWASQDNDENYRVFWLRNEAEVMLDDNVEINSEDGSLLILRAGAANEGSYACGIKGSGSNKDHSAVRLGDAVVINVRSDGSWSPWGAWRECSSRCGRGQRTRLRSCSNPPPRHGGRDCPGDYISRSECNSRKDCPNSHSREKDDKDEPSVLPGTWSQWSVWSECGLDCRKYRHRMCTTGVVGAQSHYTQHRAHGGSSSSSSTEDVAHPQRHAKAVCLGRYHMAVNCTGGACPVGAQHANVFHPQLGPVNPGPERGYKGLSNNFLQEQGSISSQEQGFLLSHVGSLEAIAMVIGMALAAIILAFTFLIAVRFWPRDGNQTDKRQLSTASHHMDSYNTHVPVNGVATLPPCDVSGSINRDLRLKDFATEGKLEAAVTIPLLQTLYSHPSSCSVPMTPSQTRSNFNMNRSRTPSSTDKTHRTDSESQSYSDYGAPGSTSEPDLIYDTIPDELKSSTTSRSSMTVCVPNHQIAWITVGPEGGRVGLDRLGVWLTVPPGAIRHGRREMYIGVPGDGERERPVGLHDEQSVLSAVVQCGPIGVPLARPVVVSFDHCAHPPSEKWNIHLLSADTNSDLHPHWKQELSVMSSGEDVISKRAYVQMDNRMCHLQTDKLCRFVLVGESRNKCFAAKSLVLVAFLSKISSLSQKDYSVRVYCVEDTKAALQNVYNDENGRSIPLDEPKSMILHDGGANLCLTLEAGSLSDEWEFKPGANQQEIPFSHVWSSRLSLLHCSFVLTSTSHAEVSKLVGRVTVFQRGNQSHRQILTLNSAAVYRNTAEIPTPTLPSAHISNSLISRTGGSTIVPAEGFRLSPEVRLRICALLDAPHPEGNDWRRLAQHLALDGNLSYYASKVSPTACLLDLWEARHREAGAPTGLLAVLKNLGRPDVSGTLEKLFGAWV